MSLHESSISLRKETIDDKIDDLALKYDVWGQVCVRYALRVVGLRTEF